MFKQILREPLFHFFIIGLCLFIGYGWLNPAMDMDENNIIHIDENVVNRLSATYEQNWRKVPDSTELAQLIDQEIKMEVFYREALKMNLEHNDEIVRRRLSQKYEFLVKDLADLNTPDENVLQAFYQKNQHRYQTSKHISFNQIYFNPDQRKDPKANADQLLAMIEAKTIKDIESAGDPSFYLQIYH